MRVSSRYRLIRRIQSPQASPMRVMRNAAAKAMFDKHEAEQRARRETVPISRPERGREAC